MKRNETKQNATDDIGQKDQTKYEILTRISQGKAAFQFKMNISKIESSIKNYAIETNDDNKLPFSITEIFGKRDTDTNSLLFQINFLNQQTFEAIESDYLVHHP